MATAAVFHKIAHFLTFPVDIRNVCVFLAPVFSALTSIACYLMTREITGKTGSGLYSALFIAVVPSYISRSVAGSYDNEGIAIFALVFTFYLFLKSVNTGSLLWSAAASLSYFYMVAAWGGYAFIINIIPIFVLGIIFIGKYSTNLYIAYSAFYVMGTFLAMQIPFVGLQAINSSEHLASHIVFVFLQVYVLSNWVRDNLGETKFRNLAKVALGVAISLLVLYALYVTLTGKMKWTLRSLSLLDPTYAKKHIPIIASVSEHQPTTWSSFFFDLHFLTVFTTLGLYFLCMEYNEGKLFAALYGVLSVYFASVMVRLLLVLAPALCVIAGIGLSETIHRFALHITHFKEWYDYHNAPKSAKPPKPQHGYPLEISLMVLLGIAAMTVFYIAHCVWVGSEAYSSPTIIMASKTYDGQKLIIDDYREAYYWLRMNTDEEAKIMSWWDYGYQITGMANRTVLVDNNTWNYTHIATVGMAFASNEEEAANILRKLDVDYVLLLFGGMSYYSGDDINKFLWMVRIASGVFPHIKEDDFLQRGMYRVDEGATKTMRDCLMYKLSYYRFGEVMSPRGGTGFDLVRQAEIPDKNIKLKHFKEVYTTSHWIVRIYQLLPESNRDTLLSKSKYTRKSKEELSKYNLVKTTKQ